MPRPQDIEPNGDEPFFPMHGEQVRIVGFYTVLTAEDPRYAGHVAARTKAMIGKVGVNHGYLIDCGENVCEIHVGKRVLACLTEELMPLPGRPIIQAEPLNFKRD